jgi:hypothetical protein
MIVNTSSPLPLLSRVKPAGVATLFCVFVSDQFGRDKHSIVAVSWYAQGVSGAHASMTRLLLQQLLLSHVHS